MTTTNATLGMWAGVLEVLSWWLLLSVVVMATMTVYILGSARQRRAGIGGAWHAPGGPANVLRLSEKMASPWAPEREEEQSRTVFTLDEDLEIEVSAGPPEGGSAVTGLVDSESAVIERLLAGVSLPCGLEQIVPSDHDAERLAFLTSAESPRIVAVSVADELQRLGLEVEPLSYTEARVWRDGFELALTIHLEPRSVIRNRKAVFSHAPRDSVVVEFAVV